jgi:hypothetical protein
MAIYSLLLRNKLFPQSFSSIRSLALGAAALQPNKAIFFGGIPLGQMKLYSNK